MKWLKGRFWCKIKILNLLFKQLFVILRRAERVVFFCFCSFRYSEMNSSLWARGIPRGTAGSE